MTKNGKIILELIESEACHPTAEEVYRILADSENSMSLATVYNNLSALCQDGLIREITIPNQPAHYDKVMPHDHLICENCGAIKDLFLKSRKKELEKEAGVKIDSYDLQLYYMCEDCSA